jgi:O-antigen/teichoic acid export membrane protein
LPRPPQPEILLTSDQVANAAPGSRARQLMGILPVATFWALVAQGILSVTRLLTTMTVGGKFGSGSEEQLGYYSNGFAALMVMIAIFEAFVTTPLTVFNQKQPADRKSVFSGQMLIAGLLVIGGIAAVCGILFGLQLYTQKVKPELAAALVAVACMAPFQLIREFSRRWLLANLRVRASAGLEVAFAGLFFIGVFTLVATGNVSALTMFFTLAVVNAIGCVSWWLIFRESFSFNSSIDQSSSIGNQLIENIRYGRWVAGENVCSTLTMYFSSWYLTWRLDEAAAGVFFACFTVVMLANPFLLGISSILAPRAAQGFNDQGYLGLVGVLLKLGSVLMLVMIAISVLLWFAGDRVTTLLFPAEYAGYFDQHFGGINQITAVLGLALPALGLSYISAFGLLAAHRPRDNFVSAAVGVAVLMIVNFCFAETTLLTVAISFVASYYAAMACRTGFLLVAFLKHS